MPEPDNFDERIRGLFIPRKEAPPPAGHMHLTEEELWGLAGYDGAALSAGESEGFRRMLECSRCFNELGDIRMQIRAVEAELRTARLHLGLQLFQAALAAAIPRALRVRGAVRTRGAPAPAQPAGPRTIELGPHRATVLVEAESSEDNLCKITMTLAEESRHLPTAHLVARLRCGQEIVEEKLFGEDYSVTFTGRKPAEYDVELVLGD